MTDTEAGPAGATGGSATLEPGDLEARSASIPFAVPIGVVFVVVTMAYAIWAAFTGHGRFPSVLPGQKPRLGDVGIRVGYGVDSAYYIAAAKAPIWSMEFLATPNGAPFLFPLLAKICLRNLRAIVLVQSVLAAAAWLFLARTVASRMHRPAARVFAFTTLLLLALSPVVLMWNTFIATEALSNMLLCVAIALFIRLTGGTAGRHDFAWFAVVLAALACTRDTYAVVLLVVAVLAGVVGLVRRDLRRRGAIIAAVCLVAAVTNIGLSNHAGRWFDPLDETIAVRLLGSHEATQYFVDHGMPYDARVKALHKPNAIVFKAYNVTYGKEYEKYRNWLLSDGRSTYTSFLLTHPWWDVSKPFDDRRRVLTPDLRDYGRTYHNEPRGAFEYVGKAGMPQVKWVLEAWVVLALLAAMGLWWRRRDRALLLATGVVAFLVLPHFMVAWHGDALELDRHIISAAVQLRIVLWIVAAMVLDAVLDAVRERRAKPGSVEV
jgi:hypothetical protein